MSSRPFGSGPCAWNGTRTARRACWWTASRSTSGWTSTTCSAPSSATGRRRTAPRWAGSTARCTPARTGRTWTGGCGSWTPRGSTCRCCTPRSACCGMGTSRTRGWPRRCAALTTRGRSSAAPAVSTGCCPWRTCRYATQAWPWRRSSASPSWARGRSWSARRPWTRRASGTPITIRSGPRPKTWGWRSASTRPRTTTTWAARGIGTVFPASCSSP